MVNFFTNFYAQRLVLQAVRLMLIEMVSSRRLEAGRSEPDINRFSLNSAARCHLFQKRFIHK
jgi:hypothetical protein